MKLSDSAIALIKASEGFRGQEYLDVAGIPTIGYGHKLLPGESFAGGVTEAQAEEILARDAAHAAAAVSGLVHVPLSQGQFDALVDFTFNLGAGRLEQSTLLRDLNAGQYSAAALQLLLWDHAGAKELPALKTRRRAEFKMWTGRDAPGK